MATARRNPYSDRLQIIVEPVQLAAAAFLERWAILHAEAWGVRALWGRGKVSDDRTLTARRLPKCQRGGSGFIGLR